MATVRPVPEDIDFAIDHDPDGAQDPCVHEAESGPHAHRALRDGR